MRIPLYLIIEDEKDKRKRANQEGATLEIGDLVEVEATIEDDEVPNSRVTVIQTWEEPAPPDDVYTIKMV